MTAAFHAPAHATMTTLRVRYAETDAMGVAHHATYPVWFEVGRSDLMRALGLSYAEVEAQGYFLMLTELTVQYRRAVQYDEALTLYTWLGDLRSRTLRFDYALCGSAGLAALGHSSHIVTNHSYQPQRLPEALRRVLAEQLEGAGQPEGERRA